MIKAKFIFLFLCFTIFISCDKGIEPLEEVGPSSFSGKVTFEGNWPAGIKRTHLVVFKEEIKNVNDFFLPNLVFVVDSIPYKAKEFNYNSLEKPFSAVFKMAPGSYKYIVIAQSKTPELTFYRADWNVVGVYCESGNQIKPKTMLVNPGKNTPDINIVVNFNSPPPQPPM